MENKDSLNEVVTQPISEIFVTSYDDLAKAILAPIEAPFQEDIEDHPDFDEVSDELMKRGTLSHGSIDWNLVESSALAMLKETQKSCAVLEALLLSRMTRKTRGALASCVRGFDAYLSLPLADLYPEEDRRFELILRRSCKIFDMESLPGKRGSEADGLEESLKRLTLNQLLIDKGLTKGFRLLLERSQLEKKLEEQTKDQKPDPSLGAGLGPATEVLSNAKSMDTRSFKRVTAEICTSIFQQDPSLPYIYQLRRHACWQDLNAAPQIKKEDRTIIPAVSVDTCDKYRQAAESKTVDINIIHQLETTLFSMPFWLEGQFLAAQLALKADHIQASNAILESTQHFITRIPELRELCFEDGTPFIEGATIEWLNSKPAEQNTPQQTQDKPESKTLIDFAENPNLASKWNGEYKSYKSPRQKAFMELGMLEELASTGFSALVSDQVIRLQSTVESMSITDWDPEFFKRSNTLTRRGKR
ncbi:TssA family type VI secretion system protein [Pseudovibrio axinellae]|nr:TssA family type VI secretion system protein [Pseudovibrio axinellae]